MIIVLLVVVVLAILWFVTDMKAEKKPKDRVRLYCGTMGAGKTFDGVNDDIKAYKKMMFKYKIKLLKDKPHFFSNIPIELRKMTKQEKQYLTAYCGRPIKCVNDVVSHYKDTGENLRPLLERWGVLNEWLLKEHLLLEKTLPNNTCLFADELSLIADQYSHDIPEVREQIVFFIGFCRHWFLGHGGILAGTAQATDSIVKQVRSKFGVCVLLNNFRRWLLITPFYKVDCHNLLNVDDTRVVEQKVEAKNKPYYFGWLGYKKKYYNSKCYKLAYDEKFIHTPDFEYNLCTRYIIDIQCSVAKSKDYKANREKYRAVLFSDSEVNNENNKIG